MATQVAEYAAPSGLTLTTYLFTPGSDTIVATSTGTTERTNDKGTYRGSFTDAPAGTYRLKAIDAGGSAVAVYQVTVAAADGTYYAYEPVSVVELVTAAINSIWSAGTRTLTSVSGLGIATAVKLLKYVQLLARSDAAIATDNATELGEINANGGSGAGDYASTTDSLEALKDQHSEGTGARAVTITVTDGTDPLPGARVRVTKGLETHVTTADGDGVTEFSLNDGDWTVSITLFGYDFTPVSLTVDGNEDVTYSMTLSGSTITPSDPGYTTAFIRILQSNETPQTNKSVGLKLKGIPLSEVGNAHNQALRSDSTDALGIAEWTNVIKGATYELYIDSILISDVYIPEDAGDEYEMQSVIWG